MIEKTIAAIEDRISSSQTGSDASREELLGLLAKLRREIAEVPEPDRAYARSIAKCAAAYTDEAVRLNRRESVLEQALHDLNASVENVENSHPELVRAVNALATMLANLGI